MNTQSPSASVRAEAAAWVARLHSTGRSRALESGLKRWLKADPAHAEAFELATAAWEIGGSIPGAALPRMAGPFSVRRESRAPAPIRHYIAMAAAFCAVAVGVALYLNQGAPAVSTGVGEQRMLTLEDGTRIFLNTDTRLFVQEDAKRRHVLLENGEALFDVATNPVRPFTVAAGDKEVLALGTSFVVRRDADELSITLMEGKVAVDAQELLPGQRLTFVRSEPVQLDEPALEKVTAWRRGEVILDKTRLQDAVDEMNRYSAIKLVLSNASTAEIRISGIFRAGDSARFAQAVGETYRLSVDHEARRIVLSGPSE